MINVTQSNLPPLEEYGAYLSGVWARGQLTNHGPLVQQLEAELSKYLDGAHVQLTANGTVALQLAIRALGLSGEIVTTPFSFVATAAAVLWERCEPVFADIDPHTFCLDPARPEAAITPRTSAILATHVYGYPCAVDEIAAVARRHGLKVLYDGAHAFGGRLRGRPLLNYGDLAVCSFHATKLFHTGEGGAVVTTDPQLARRVAQLRAHGAPDEGVLPGPNGKISELHAALGPCLLPRVAAGIAARRQLVAAYRVALADAPLQYPRLPPDTDYNHAYFPVVFASEAQLLRTQAALAAQEVNTRRYFFPALHHVFAGCRGSCPVAESVAARVLCLPFYEALPLAQAARIGNWVCESLLADAN